MTEALPRTILNRDETASYLNISKPKLDELIHRQQHPIPVIRLGRRVLIHVENLNTWLKEEAERNAGAAY